MVYCIADGDSAADDWRVSRVLSVRTFSPASHPEGGTPTFASDD